MRQTAAHGRTRDLKGARQITNGPAALPGATQCSLRHQQFRGERVAERLPRRFRRRRLCHQENVRQLVPQREASAGAGVALVENDQPAVAVPTQTATQSRVQGILQYHDGAAIHATQTVHHGDRGTATARGKPGRGGAERAPDRRIGGGVRISRRPCRRTNRTPTSGGRARTPHPMRHGRRRVQDHRRRAIPSLRGTRGDAEPGGALPCIADW